MTRSTTAGAVAMPNVATTAASRGSTSSQRSSPTIATNDTRLSARPIGSSHRSCRAHSRSSRRPSSNTMTPSETSAKIRASASVRWSSQWSPPGPSRKPVAIYPVIAGRTRVVAARRPPMAPASSSSPNSAKLLGPGGHDGRKSGGVTLAWPDAGEGFASRRPAGRRHDGHDRGHGRRARDGNGLHDGRPPGQGRIFSPVTPTRLRSTFTRSSRDTPSHMTSDAITSADE